MRFQIAQALAHFLWEGAALAILLWASLRFLRGAKARYNACAVALALMCAAPVATFFWLAPRAVTMPGVRGIILDTALPAAGASSANWFEANATSLFSLWVVGALILLARSAVAWWRAHLLVTHDFCALPGNVEFAARRLAVQLGAKRVRFRASARVASALVFGWLKPVIVLPTAVLGRLTEAEIEALLAHELAHIIRGDFLVNLLQTFAECVLFYHPLVWWVSAQMRDERELCCDDIAVAVCRDEVLYSRALLRLEELRMEPALAATGGRLALRIRRLLVGCEAERMNVAPVFALLLMLGVSVALLAQNAPPPPPAPPAPASIVPPPSDSAISKPRYRSSGDVSKPRLVYRVEPGYTPEALAARVAGIVVLSVVVTPEGTATDFKVVKSLDKGLDAKAIEAVRKWKFAPARKNGRPVPVIATIETTFLLDGPPPPPVPAVLPVPEVAPMPRPMPRPHPAPLPAIAPIPPSVPSAPEPAIAPEPPEPPEPAILPEPEIAPEPPEPPAIDGALAAPPAPPAPPARGLVGGARGGVVGGVHGGVPAPRSANSTELERRKRYADDRFGGANTDRGKVYMHYGPPDEIESQQGPGKGGTEVWRYKDDSKSKVTLELEFQDGKQVRRAGGLAADI